MIILLDIDGVMVDLVEGICNLFGKTQEDIKEEWRVKSNFWEDERISIVLDTNTQEIWDKLEAASPNFWMEMKEFSWAKEMWDWCRGASPTYFVTAPTPYPGCLTGKQAWMQAFTGDRIFSDYMIGKPKFLCAGPDRVLVDDSRCNCREFIKAGGRAVLFPRYYNGNEAENPWATIKPVLEKLVGDQAKKNAIKNAIETVDGWSEQEKMILGPPPKSVLGFKGIIRYGGKSNEEGRRSQGQDGKDAGP